MCNKILHTQQWLIHQATFPITQHSVVVHMFITTNTANTNVQGMPLWRERFQVFILHV